VLLAVTVSHHVLLRLAVDPPDTAKKSSLMMCEGFGLMERIVSGTLLRYAPIRTMGLGSLGPTMNTASPVIELL
jgi:hypothetical protein